MAIYVGNEEVQKETVAEEVVSAAPSVVTNIQAPDEEPIVETEPEATEEKGTSKPSSERLSQLSYVKDFNIQDDGKTFINIGSKAETELGRLLSWTSPIKDLYTIYGKVGTIRNFSDAITVKGFPVEYMGMARIPKDILEKHVFQNTSKKLSIPNYWSLIAYVTAESIRARKNLVELIKNNDLDYACVTEKRKATVFGTEIVIPSTIRQMIYYVGIVRGLTELVKADKIYDNAAVGQFISDCKFAPDKDIGFGVELNNISVVK